MEGEEDREYSGDDSGSVYEDENDDSEEGGDGEKGDDVGDDNNSEDVDEDDESIKDADDSDDHADDRDVLAGAEMEDVDVETGSRSDVTASDISDRVAFLLANDCCRLKCLSSKEGQTHNFVAAYMKMSKECQRTCLATTLALCQPLSVAQTAQTQPPDSQRSPTTRTRYAYYLPIVGSVCKPAFQSCFNISNDTLAK